MNNNLKSFLIFFIIINLALAAWAVFNGTIEFHTDIARDFLVMQDMVENRKPTLIGPRAGGIPGMFHGPLWFYLNLPAFILGGGNPIVVGWFWVLLSAGSLIILYYSGRKVFNEKTALLGILIFSVFLINYTKALFNSFGAVILFPLFFYLFSVYIKSVKVLYLLGALLVLGLVAQFQVGFGGTIIFLTYIYLIYFIVKKRKWKHSLALPIILIPLSSFILFELRHNFFQLRSALNFFTTAKSSEQFNLFVFLTQRLKGFAADGLGLFPVDNLFIIPYSILFAWILLKLKNKKLNFSREYKLYFYFYIGFWLLMFVFKGAVWGFFYWAFLPVTILIFSSFYKNINQKLFAILFSIVLLFNFYYVTKSLKNTDFGWKNYHRVAVDIYRDARREKEFGYYVWSPDQYAYSGKYALLYTRKEFVGIRSFPYTKKRITYLLIEGSPRDQPWNNSNWWLTDQVKIKKKPAKIFKYPNGLRVEKYILTDEEIKIPSDPNLIQDLTFR